jgi:hypothetical protein
MIDFKDVIESWAKVMTRTDEEKVEANRRLNICASCPERKLGGVFMYCGACSCPLAAKAYSKNGCPLKRW